MFTLWVSVLFFWAPFVPFHVAYAIWSAITIALVMCSFAWLGKWAGWHSVAGLAVLGAATFSAFLDYDLGQVDALILFGVSAGVVCATRHQWSWLEWRLRLRSASSPSGTWLPATADLAGQLDSCACGLWSGGTRTILRSRTTDRATSRASRAATVVLGDRGPSDLDRDCPDRGCHGFVGLLADQKCGLRFTGVARPGGVGTRTAFGLVEPC